MIVDTHSHLYLPDFEHPHEVVKRALDAGVGHIIFPNVDLTTIEPMKALHHDFPEYTSMAVGFHPTEVNDDWQQSLAVVEEELISDPSRYVAVGEIGIDLYWDKSFREQQMLAFERQIQWATRLNLPVIIHCREGLDEVLEVLSGAEKTPQGVFHSFGGTVEDVERIRRTGDFYFGINGIVTFKNSRLREVLPAIGPDRLLLETDAPYLSPVPHRGKRNESSYIIHTAAHMAASLGLSADDLADITTANAKRLFNISHKS